MKTNAKKGETKATHTQQKNENENESRSQQNGQDFQLQLAVGLSFFEVLRSRISFDKQNKTKTQNEPVVFVRIIFVQDWISALRVITFTSYRSKLYESPYYSFELQE